MSRAKVAPFALRDDTCPTRLTRKQKAPQAISANELGEALPNDAQRNVSGYVRSYNERPS